LKSVRQLVSSKEVGKKEIGRKSQRILGGDSLGIEDIFACFQISGTTPDDNETLNISVMGSAKIYAKVFRIFDGMLSGPGAFIIFSFKSLSRT
jgi:hypothetical protein